MQTDIWLTDDIDHSERCPLCSQPLRKGSTTCFSCGFSTKFPTGTSVWLDPAVYGLPLSSQKQSFQISQEARLRNAREFSQAQRRPNPNTPVPPRASAQTFNVIPGSIVKPQRSQKNTTSGVEKKRGADRRGAPDTAFGSLSDSEAQKNLTIWEYETPVFQAMSSLHTHSLLISEKPTWPELEAQGKVTHRLPGIDEIKTVPPQNIDHSITTSRSLVPVITQYDVISFHGPAQKSTRNPLSQEVDATSWTAGKGSKSSHARLISSRSRRKRAHMAVSFNPIDRLRWWLLRPGHIEFIIWLGGTILLVAVTCVLLFITAFSLEWITPGFIGPTSSNTSGTSMISGQQSTLVATPKMVLIRVDKGPILPGQSLELRGEGFSPQGHIRFLFDGKLLLFDQKGQSTATQANTHGVFATSIVLNNNLPWHPGAHFINAQDLTTKWIVKLPIFLSPDPIGKSLSNTPIPSYPPNVTPPSLTPIPSVPGGQPTPVRQTPVPVSPTPHPVTPTSTPTVGTTPTATSTVGTAPTVSPIVRTTSGVKTRTRTTVSSGLENALDNTGDSYQGKQLAHVSSWLWLMIACYCLSMVLFGLAGVLYKRHR
jgi:hypothetical protein